MLLEGERIAHAASGRNGGFLIHSLTHGLPNGMARYPGEVAELKRLGLESFDAGCEAIERYGIDCDLELTGDLAVALEPHEVDWLTDEAAALARFGHDVEMLDGEAVRAEVRSPTYRAARWQRSGSAIVDPARLAWGLAHTASELGARIHERTRVTDLRDRGAAIALQASAGGADGNARLATLSARRVLLATAAFPGLVAPLRRRVVPVYDYVLVSEPLSTAQRADVGWPRRQGIGDLANQFHYYRLTADDRILWGGYDAIYNFGSRTGRDLEQSNASSARLSQHFFTTFPQLEGLRFTHRWGGAIDTCSRFFAFFGTSHQGRVAYCAGHTGLGVGASRFGARVGLDLLAGRETRATRLRAVREQPLPFPPEPLRWAAIQLTRNRLAAADCNRGRRGAWLRLLDRLGLGFDS